MGSRTCAGERRILLVLLVLITAANAARVPKRQRLDSSKQHAHEVTHLPGYSGRELPSKQYSGYITVDEDHGRKLWYWLVMSEYQPASDPVVLWLTGGPGCSSLDAFIYEHGPFTFTYAQGGTSPDIVLDTNPYSWSKAATMIYVDSPAGAGLSYSQVEGDYATDDERTTWDVYHFLQSLLDLHPQLRARDLYVAGESYGGVYVPLLAQKILNMNEQVASSEDRINIKGYMTGNGVADDMFDGNGQPEFAYGMGLIDPTTYRGLQDICAGNYWNATPASTCGRELRRVYDTLYWVNPYDILDDCYSQQSRMTSSMAAAAIQTPATEAASEATSTTSMTTATAAATATEAAMDKDAKPWRQLLGHQPMAWPAGGVFDRSRSVPNWGHLLGHAVPCADRRVALDWLNREEVRRALHALPVSDLEWQPCSDVLHYNMTAIGMVPVHRDLISRGLRALIYSGDHDFVVPFTGTRAWVYSMALDVDRPYAAWTVDGQVAGFAVAFKQGLTFATVKGAGHMVPQTSPARALHLITRFLLDKL